MFKILKILFNTFLFSVLFYQSTIAQDITLNATVDRSVVSLGEQITFQVTVNGNVSDINKPQLPDLKDFNVGSAGTSQNISIINGQVSTSLTYNYILVPKSIGKFTIGSVTLVHKGKTYTTNPINIEVQQPTQKQQEQIPIKKNVYKGEEKNIFLETIVDKKTAYVNEQITLTLRFYRRVELLSQPEYTPPSTTGFLIEDLPPQKNFYTVIDGQKYLVTEIKTALFPALPGKHTIGSATLKCTIQDFSAPNIDDFFNDDFFRQFFSKGKTITLQSKPIEINVLSLPSENKPQDFSGSIGKYRIGATLDKAQMQTGEALTLTIDINGQGNIKAIPEQKFEIKNFRKYDTITSMNITKQNYVVGGSKIFKTILIPEFPGEYVIPQMKFCYFNPETKKYEYSYTQPLKIKVNPGKTPSVSIPQLPQTSSLKIGTKDIRYIKTTLSGNVRYSPYGIYSHRFVLLFQILLLVIPLGLWRYQIWKEKFFADTGKVKYTYAYKTAKNKLKNLYDKFNKTTIDTNIFVNNLFDILCEYISSKLYISQHGITGEFILSEFEQRKIDTKIKDELKYIWDEINFMQFAPAKFSKDKIFELYNKIISLLENLEKIL